MAQQDESILIDVKINTDEVTTKLAAAITATNQYKAAQAELNKTIKDQGYATKEQAAELAEVSKGLTQSQRETKAYTAALQVAATTGEQNNMTLNEQRQYLNSLQAAYGGLTAAEKANTEAGQTLAEQIKAVSDNIKEQEHAIGDDRRNVGNYTESIIAANDKTKLLADTFKATAVGQTALGKATDSVDKAMKIAAKNPWMAVLSLLLPILKKLFDALKGNKQVMDMVEQVMQKLRAAFKQFEPIIKKVASLYMNVLAKAFDVVLAAITKVLEGVDWLASKFGMDLHLADAFKTAGTEATEMADDVEEANERVTSSTRKAIEEENRLREQQAQRLAEIRDEIRRRNQTDLENQLEDLRNKMQEELNIVGLTEEEKQAIRDHYAELEQQAKDDAQAAIDKAAADEAAKEQAKLEARQKAREQFGIEPGKTPEEQELELLQQAREQDLLNAEEYEIAKTLITDKYSKQREDAIQAEVDKATKLYEQEMKNAGSAAQGAMNALGELVGAFADDSEEASKAQQAFAMGSILINQAMAIAEGAKGIASAMAGAAVAAAATGPAAPIMLGVYQAQMVGQVLALVASVASSIAQAKQIFSQADQFSTGGIVGGTSYTGDNVPARLNSREMVLNMDQQTRLFDALGGTSDGQTLGIDYEMLAAACANTPAPVLAYSEFEEFNQKRVTYNEFAKV